jgi:hypothetical protein
MPLFQGPRQITVLPLINDLPGGGIVRDWRCVFHIGVSQGRGDDGIVGLAEHLRLYPKL